MLAFRTDAFNHADGWKVTYHTVITDIDEQITNDMLVFPNPANNMVSIQFQDNMENTTISLLSITGARIYEMKMKNENHVEIPVSSIKEGLYLLEVANNKSHITKKLLIRH